MKYAKQCSENDCEKKLYCLGYCRHHYYLFKRYGVTQHKRNIPSCSVDDCENRHYAKGLCRRHYDVERYGPKRINRVCSRENCKRKHYAKGLCKSHYNSFISKCIKKGEKVII